jgi:hypothetical protein
VSVAATELLATITDPSPALCQYVKDQAESGDTWLSLLGHVPSSVANARRAVERARDGLERAEHDLAELLDVAREIRRRAGADLVDIDNRITP